MDRMLFQQQGFLVVPGVLDVATVERLRERFPKLFRGEFDTGVFPDEWYWREGMSLPDVTRHMSGTWKSDLTVAGVVLSARLGRLASELMGWSGARIGLDTIWWKVPGAKAIALHQDDTYMSFLDPPETVTVWLALDDTSREAGTIEYVAGSHRWPLKPDIGDFHAPDAGYRAAMLAAARAAGQGAPEPVKLEVKAGDAVVHSGRIWHGSDRNQTADRTRRSIGVHLLRDDVRYGPGRAGYIYGRYQRQGERTLDENFFPVIWREDGYRTSFLADYCRDALA